MTENLDYDRMYGVGMYLDGGTLYDADNVLVSDWGQYTPATHEAFFTDNVQLTNPKFTLVSDTLLLLYRHRKWHRFMSPTNITISMTVLSFMSVRASTTPMGGQAICSIVPISLRICARLWAIACIAIKETGVDEAFGNVIITDDENQCMLKGNYCVY